MLPLKDRCGAGREGNEELRSLCALCSGVEGLPFKNA